MHRWAPFPLLCLMACVNEVGDWPEEEYSRSNPTEVQESAESRATESGLFPQERPLNADTEESSSGAADATEEDAAPADAWEDEEEAGAPEAEEDTGFPPCNGSFCDWPADWVAMEHEVLALVNEIRVAGATCANDEYPPVAALDWNENLADAARAHSQDMGEQGYFDHDSLDGRSPWQRMRDASFYGSPVAENIAAGSHTAASVVNSWMNSPGHCRNIMSSRATALGVGYAYVAGSPWGHYWTQAFGAE